MMRTATRVVARSSTRLGSFGSGGCGLRRGWHGGQAIKRTRVSASDACTFKVVGRARDLGVPLGVNAAQPT